MAARLTLDSPVTLYCRQSAELGTRGSVQATELGLTRDQHTNSNITYNYNIMPRQTLTMDRRAQDIPCYAGSVSRELGHRRFPLT